VNKTNQSDVNGERFTESDWNWLAAAENASWRPFIRKISTDTAGADRRWRDIFLLQD
jgi:hypothetical protein